MSNYRIVVVLDSIDPERLSSFWASALDYERASSDEPYVVLVSRDRAHPELVLQRVSEPKFVKNRMHLDIRVTDLDEEVSRLHALGARRLSAVRMVGSPSFCSRTREDTEHQDILEGFAP